MTDVLYQPKQSTPDDWLVVNSLNWAGLGSFKLNALCIQGVVFDGADHYSVEMGATETRVIVWHDDPVDWPMGTRWARITTFRLLAPDAAMGGAINTNQTQVIYAEGTSETIFKAKYDGHPDVVFGKWADFDPRRVAPLDGEWLTDAEYEAHQDKQSVRSWREWTEGLDPRELDENGLLKGQREQGRYKIPDGTITYFQRDTQTLQDIHTLDQSTANEASLLFTTAAAAQLQQGGLAPNEDVQAFTYTTAAGEPGFSQWPTGTYRAQIEGDNVGAGVSYGMRDQGVSSGHFARVNSGLTADLETKQMVTALFTGTGLKLGDTGSVSWASGSTTDRFEVLVAASRDGVGHGNENCHCLVNTSDHFADGPWVTGVAAPGDTPFFGANA